MIRFLPYIIKERAKQCFKSKSGMGTVEIVLIIIVLVGLALIFKTQISGIVDTVITKIRTKVGSF